MFINIEEVVSFWRFLWEVEGIGDIGVDWLEEVRCVIREKVFELMEENFIFSEVCVVKVIGKKCNWSVFGFDCLVNYWWKRVKCLYEGIVILFEVIV